MAFNPSTALYLCNVPFDNTYKHQIYFSNATDQRVYFTKRIKKTYSEYLTIRKTLANGGLESRVKVGANIDDLRSLGINYMFYQNANHGSRYFYAFVTNMVYINDETTELLFETDVYQTWLFDVELLPSYVEREHSATDKVGDNLVPESFNFQDYIYSTVTLADFGNIMGARGYLVTASANIDADGNEIKEIRGAHHSGIYQGLHFYYYKEVSKLNEFLNSLETDSVISITCIPEFIVSNAVISDDIMNDHDGQGSINATSAPKKETINISLGALSDAPFKNYFPMCQKLHTAPYYMLTVTNHNGEEAEYIIEDFKYPTNVQFVLAADISVNPTLTLFPLDYKGIPENYDSGISISNFPQCSFNTDTYKLWLTKNQYGMAMSTGIGIGQIAVGASMIKGAGAGTAVAPGIGTAIGAIGGTIAGATMFGGASTIANTINEDYKASKEPNRATTGNARTNLLTALNKNGFEIGIRTIKPEQARTIDQFFHMYGYQTNRIKVPNVSARPYFNYVKTVDINIKGDIPCDDMRALKAVYNNGVTLWKSNVTFGDYNYLNNPEYAFGNPF